MSNKLKRKISPKQTPQSNKNSKAYKLAENCYAEVFVSMQLICLTVLYSSKEDGGFDFTSQKLKNFNKFLTKHNHENVDGELSSKDTERWIYESFDIYCALEARRFPYRAKMKMAGLKNIKPSDVKVIIAGVEVAIEAYLILAIYTLHKHYKFNCEDIHKWWAKCIEVGELYAKGMTDDFVTKFITEETGIEIVR